MFFKICYKCKKSKSPDDFYTDNCCGDNKRKECKECTKEQNKKWRDKNRKRISKYNNNYNAFHKNITKEYNKEYRKLNRSYYKRYNKEYFKTYRTNREKTDISYKIANNLRSRLRLALKNNYKSGSAVRDLGCSIEFLILIPRR